MQKNTNNNLWFIINEVPWNSSILKYYEKHVYK